MLYSVLAGFLIAVGAALYLKVGGIIGAFLFSIGLMTILKFGLHLFTGKAGLLGQKVISWLELVKIWGGNLIGCGLGALLLAAGGLVPAISEAAAAIILVRIGNFWYQNIALGIFCGLFMYVAVQYYKDWPLMTIVAVAAFILLGVNHCVADMVYMFIGFNIKTVVPMFLTIIETTVGNVIGCNLLNLIRIYQKE